MAVETVNVTGNVRIVAERRHDIILRSADVLATARDHSKEVTVAHRLECILQRRCVRGAHAVGAMADVALRMITAVPRISIPIDRAIGRNFECRVALLVQILAVLGFDRCRVDGLFGESEPFTCHECNRDSHKPNYAQDLVLAVRYRSPATWKSSTPHPAFPIT